MKRSIKLDSSLIIKTAIGYVIKGDNSSLSNILKAEQKSFCAYTEKQISSTDQAEIDHFNPSLKGEAEDNYKNWYLILAKWNRKKAKKWANFQPILHPTALDFNERIWFEDGIFQYNPIDTASRNLIRLLDLNNRELTKERERYIERMKDLQNLLGVEELRDHLLKFPEQIHFLSAFELAFGYGFIF